MNIPSNSGLDANISFCIFSVVPIGEVDSIMYKSPFLSSGIIPFVAASTNEISGS